MLWLITPSLHTHFSMMTAQRYSSMFAVRLLPYIVQVDASNSSSTFSDISHSSPSLESTVWNRGYVWSTIIDLTFQIPLNVMVGSQLVNACNAASAVQYYCVKSAIRSLILLPLPISNRMALD